MLAFRLAGQVAGPSSVWHLVAVAVAVAVVVAVAVLVCFSCVFGL